jgi:hypothetical protein
MSPRAKVGLAPRAMICDGHGAVVTVRTSHMEQARTTSKINNKIWAVDSFSLISLFGQGP